MKLTGVKIGALSPILAVELAGQGSDPGARLRLENIERSWREAALARARGTIPDDLLDELYQLASNPNVTAAQLTQAHLPRLVELQRAKQVRVDPYPVGAKRPIAALPPNDPFGLNPPALVKAVRIGGQPSDRYAPYPRQPAGGPRRAVANPFPHQPVVQNPAYVPVVAPVQPPVVAPVQPPVVAPVQPPVVAPVQPPVGPANIQPPVWGPRLLGGLPAPPRFPPAVRQGGQRPPPAPPVAPQPPPPPIGPAREQWLVTALRYIQTALPPMTPAATARAIQIATAGVLTLTALYMIQGVVPTLRDIMPTPYQPVIAAASAVVDGLIATWDVAARTTSVVAKGASLAGGAVMAIIGAFFPRGSVTEAMHIDTKLWKKGEPVMWMRQSDLAINGPNPHDNTPNGVQLPDNRCVVREVINGKDRWVRVGSDTEATRTIVSRMRPRTAIIVEFGSMYKPFDVKGTKWLRAHTSMGNMYLDLTRRHVWVPIEMDPVSGEARLWQNQMKSVRTNKPPPDQGPRFSAELAPVTLQTTRFAACHPDNTIAKDESVVSTVNIPDVTVESIYKAASTAPFVERHPLPKARGWFW